MSADLRATILAEEEIQASKRRFGLFSQPPPLAIGDNSLFKQKNHLRGQNGKPISNPPQMLGGACHSGLSKSSYFSVPGSIHQNNVFKEQYYLDNQNNRKYHTKAKFHENQWKPASGDPKILDKPSYDYQTQKTPAKKPIERDSMGKVMTKAKNVTTNPISKVQKQFFKTPAYMHDPYERKKQLQNRQWRNSKNKFQEGTFRSMSHGNHKFQKDIDAIGQDPKAKLTLSMRKQRSETTFKIYPHQGCFRPARRGHGDPVGKYPTFIQKRSSEPIGISLKRLKAENEGQKKDSWTPNNHGLSRPTPSIMFNPVSLKTGRYK